MTKRYLREVTTPEDLQAALQVRRAVFTEEQGIDAAIEVDEHDASPDGATAVHVLCSADDVPVAAARLLLHEGQPGQARIGRVAVLSSHRGQGYGRLVIEALHEIARKRGYREAVLGAEISAVPFYLRLGYVCEGEPYEQVGIEHQGMRFTL